MTSECILVYERADNHWDVLSKAAAYTLKRYKQEHNGDAGAFPAFWNLVHDTLSSFEQTYGAFDPKYDEDKELDDSRRREKSRRNGRYAQGY
jgi:hypothetical protein